MEVLRRSTAQRSWDEEITAHLPSLHGYALGLARNFHAAEDLVQDTIVKAYSCKGKFLQGSNLRAWLFTILRNTFLSGLRKQKREVADSDGVHAAGLITHPEHDGRLAMSEFLRAFERLSPGHRDIVILVGVSGHSYEVASRMIGIPVGTAKSRLSRARSQLNEALDPPTVARRGGQAGCTIFPVARKAPQGIKSFAH